MNLSSALVAVTMIVGGVVVTYLSGSYTPFCGAALLAVVLFGGVRVSMK